MGRIFVSEDKQSMVMLLKGTVESLNNGSPMVPMSANTVDAAVEKSTAKPSPSRSAASHTP